MNKQKRGVIISSSNNMKIKKTVSQAIKKNKGKSPIKVNHNESFINEQNLAESNLLSSGVVDQQNFTQDQNKIRNLFNHINGEKQNSPQKQSDFYSDKNQQSDSEFIIQSMHEKKQIEQKKQEEQKMKVVKNAARKAKQIIQRNKRSIRSHQQKRKEKVPIKTLNTQKDDNFPKKQQKKLVNNLKPKPLEYNADMFSKVLMHSPHKKNTTQKDQIQPINLQNINRNYLYESLQSDNQNKNPNSTRLPFRFQEK